MPVATADQTNVLSEALKVWDVESSQEMLTLERHNSNVWSVALNPSGRRMVSGSGDKTLKVSEADSVAIGWMYESESVPLVSCSAENLTSRGPGPPAH